MKAELLLQVNRSDITEREHYGFITVVDKNENIIHKIGNPDTVFYLRSCEKPFQALPVITSGTFKKFKFTLQELAVCCASHSGSKEHTKTIKSILDKIGLKEEHLKCGIHEPFDGEEKLYLKRNDIKPTQLHNNCSGKHAGMLAVCVNNGWDIDNYLDFEHDLQVEIFKTLKKYCNITDDVIWSRDGCSAPTRAIPLYKMGTGYLKLFLSHEGELIKKAFNENPVLIGGKGRQDTVIIESAKGLLIAKVGAEGLCVVINLKEEKALIVKILDSSMQARGIVLIESLKQLGWINSEDLKNKEIQNIFTLSIKIRDDKLVGEITSVFKLKTE